MGAMGPQNDPHFCVLSTRHKSVQVQNNWYNSFHLTPLISLCNVLELVICG